MSTGAREGGSGRSKRQSLVSRGPHYIGSRPELPDCARVAVAHATEIRRSGDQWRRREGSSQGNESVESLDGPGTVAQLRNGRAAWKRGGLEKFFPPWGAPRTLAQFGKGPGPVAQAAGAGYPLSFGTGRRRLRRRAGEQWSRRSGENGGLETGGSGCDAGRTTGGCSIGQRSAPGGAERGKR